MKLSNGINNGIKASAFTLLLSFASPAYDVLAQNISTKKGNQEISVKDKNIANFESILGKDLVANIKKTVNDFGNQLTGKEISIDQLKPLVRNKFNSMSKIFLSSNLKETEECFNYFKSIFENNLSKDKDKSKLKAYYANIKKLKDSIEK